MIKCFFGVPGCGKSTTLVKEFTKLKKHYDHVYTINISIKGCTRITKDILENYQINNTNKTNKNLTNQHILNKIKLNKIN